MIHSLNFCYTISCHSIFVPPSPFHRKKKGFSKDFHGFIFFINIYYVQHSLLVRSLELVSLDICFPNLKNQDMFSFRRLYGIEYLKFQYMVKTWNPLTLIFSHPFASILSTLFSNAPNTNFLQISQ